MRILNELRQRVLSPLTYFLANLLFVILPSDLAYSAYPVVDGVQGS